MQKRQPTLPVSTLAAFLHEAEHMCTSIVVRHQFLLFSHAPKCRFLGRKHRGASPTKPVDTGFRSEKGLCNLTRAFLQPQGHRGAVAKHYELRSHWTQFGEI